MLQNAIVLLMILIVIRHVTSETCDAQNEEVYQKFTRLNSCEFCQAWRYGTQSEMDWSVDHQKALNAIYGKSEALNLPTFAGYVCVCVCVFVCVCVCVWCLCVSVNMCA